MSIKYTATPAVYCRVIYAPLYSIYEIFITFVGRIDLIRVICESLQLFIKTDARAARVKANSSITKKTRCVVKSASLFSEL